MLISYFIQYVPGHRTISLITPLTEIIEQEYLVPVKGNQLQQKEHFDFLPVTIFDAARNHKKGSIQMRLFRSILCSGIKEKHILR